jgi:hypothetical protein
MRRPRLSAYRSPGLYVLTIALLVAACREGSDAGPGPRPDAPRSATTEDDSDQPIRLAYVCGNRFLITSAYSVSVSLTWRVSDTGEEGTVLLPGAPPEDPAVSEHLIETRNRGPVELSLAGRPVRTRKNEGIPCSPSPAAPSFLTAGSTSVGEWSAVFPWPYVAVHLTLLPTGRVLSFGLKPAQIWDPATGAFTAVPAPIKIFCSGHTLLSDGRLLVAGGHILTNHGLHDITLLDPNLGTWSSGVPMQKGRWYPTTTTMANGDVVITAGSDETGITVPLPEVWSQGTLRILTGASRNFPYYPRAFLAPNGKLFYAGQQQTTRYLDINGTGSWTTVGNRLYGTRDYGSAAMYDEGKILYAGGGRTTNTAEIIDLKAAAPKWQWTGSMAFARRHFNLTILPTGEVLATGGVAGTVFNDLTLPVFAAEVWNPATQAWTTLASSVIPRGYHATSLLLPDGRVLHSGGGEGSGAPLQKNAELFSPPYLFQGPRPTIQSAPTEVGYSTTFSVETPDAATIAMVSLIRLGSVTHAFNMNQRFQRLGFMAEASGLTIAAPTDRNITPPGHYMVFILNQSGVPSVARIIKVQ